MYISRVIIKNYRSIKDLTLNFSSGKNVIVGKNNSGKSNIIKAINIVLGENSPTYVKSNNITENDFYSSNQENANKMMVFCELKKNDNEEIDISEVKKSKFYGKYLENLYSENEIISDSKEIYNTCEEYEVIYNGLQKLYFKAPSFETEFKDKISSKDKFAFLFTAQKEGETVKKDLKFLIYNNTTDKWSVFFNSQLRNILLQSAIIPAFRDPSQQLSLTQWSWYGKMMKELTNNVSTEKWNKYESILKDASKISNDIFNDVTNQINLGTIKVAFPNTELYFRFLEEKKSELYKSTKIYVDDGYMSDISLKGAGIQSAIIIGLYTYYVKNISKIKNALLCLEEPELYLHPHGKRMISNRVNDFLSGDENQAIIVTHASEFIELKNKNSKIIKITKEKNKGSVAHEINLDECREVILRNENKDIFFADKVILCEGKEKLLLEFLNLAYLNGKFDDENNSIISVEGKGNFIKYIEIAKKINVEVYLIADFDYLLRADNKEKNVHYGKTYKGDIGNLNIHYLNYISQKDDNKLQRFISKLRNKLLEYDEKKFYTSKNSKEYCDFTFKFENDELTIKDCIDKLQENNIFIQDAEVEGLFKNLKHKMNEEDIYKLYDNKNPNTFFEDDKLQRLLKFLKCI